jgi:hypothetical protein
MDARIETVSGLRHQSEVAIEAAGIEMERRVLIRLVFDCRDIFERRRLTAHESAHQLSS